MWEKLFSYEKKYEVVTSIIVSDNINTCFLLDHPFKASFKITYSLPIVFIISIRKHNTCNIKALEA